MKNSIFLIVLAVILSRLINTALGIEYNAFSDAFELRPAIIDLVILLISIIISMLFMKYVLKKDIF